jgi:hypothetical protein
MYDRLVLKRRRERNRKLVMTETADGARLSTINFAIGTQLPRLDLGSTSKIWAGASESLVARIGSSQTPDKICYQASPLGCSVRPVCPHKLE